MKKIVIFGASDMAQLAHFYFTREEKFEVAAFVISDHLKTVDQFCNLPLVSHSEMESKYPASKYAAFIALGPSKMNKNRENLYLEFKQKGYELVSYVSPRCSNFATSIGENTFIFEDNTIQPFVTIGNNVTLWSGNHIGHHSTIEDNVFITSHVVVSGHVTVGRNSFLGVNSTIRDHVKIGEANMIGIAAVITKDTEKGAVYRAPRTEKMALTSDESRL